MHKSVLTPGGVVGLFAVGHSAYWEQFDGLKETLLGYHGEVRAMFEEGGAAVVDCGMVDSNAAGYAAADKLRIANADIIVCDMVTYATSSVFAPVLKALNAPVVLVALQPLAALDYTIASTRMQLENDNICSVPEFASVAIKYGKPVADVIIGMLKDDKNAAAQIRMWCAIARALNSLKGARIGLMGHVLESMYDMHADPAMLSAAFNLHFPLLEIGELTSYYNQAGESDIKRQEARILEQFDTPDPKHDPVTKKLTAADLRMAAKGAYALDRFIESNRLDGLAYYYAGNEGSIEREVASSLIVGNSMLIANGFPMCGEFDAKTCIAMLIMDRLGFGGSFAELHPFDFTHDCILAGHDGPHHIALAEGKPILRSLTHYHGKPGSGASVEFKLKEGPVTLFGITQGHDGRVKFILGEGISQKGPIPPTGNTNTRLKFEPNTPSFIKTWVMAGPTHHFALGLGHGAAAIGHLAKALGIGFEIIKGV